jgi:general secretion pathway protein D
MSMTMCTHPLTPRSALSRRLATSSRRLTLLTLSLAQVLPLTLASQAQAQTAPESGVVKATQARTLSPALKSRTPVTLNFVNADVEAVTRAMGVMLDRQLIIDPRVKGTITVYSEQPLSVQEAFLTYLAALRGLGFTVVENTGLLKVVPESDAKLQAGSVSVGTSTQRGDQVITQIFRLSYENANNLVAVLRPLISPNNTINANPSNNTLVITDYAENLQRLGRIIAAMDLPGSSDLEVVPLKHAIASDLAALVQKLADGTASGASSGAAATPNAAAGAISVLADPRSNALILRAPNPAKLATVRAMIEKLDQPSNDSGPAGSIHVVYLKNTDATRLAVVLRAAFAVNSSSGSGAGGSGGSSGATPSSTPTSTTTSSTTTSSSSSSTAATTAVTATAAPSTGGFVQADPATNSLIITAPEPMYRQIRGVIDQLDVRRAQVYVESMIVKVDAAKAAQFGVQWQGLTGNVVGGTNFGSSTANILTLTAATASGLTGVSSAISTGLSQGLNVGYYQKINGYYTLGALANFLETKTGANVLSTPNLVAMDNEEARIIVGQNVPFVTGTYTTSSSTTSSPFQTVERKDVGLTLRIKSQIGENGTVRMTIYQENSSVLASTASNTNGPTTDKSAIETTVTVDDGATLVLGGLLKDEYSDEVDQVPVLGSLPWIGNLFKSQSRTRTKSNLMVFLRPTVLRTQAASDEVTVGRYEAIRSDQRTVQPTKSAVLPDTGASELPDLPKRAPAAVPTPATPPAAAEPAAKAASEAAN